MIMFAKRMAMPPILILAKRIAIISTSVPLKALRHWVALLGKRIVPLAQRLALQLEHFRLTTPKQISLFNHQPGAPAPTLSATQDYTT